MRKAMLMGVAAVAMPAAAQAATVTSIQYTPGVYTVPATTSATIFEEFENGVVNTGYNPATQTSGQRPEATSGTVTTAQGNVPGDYIQPDPDNNKYLAIQNGGTFSVGFGTGVSVFSFVFGTLDTYNTLRLFFNDGTNQLLTGSEIVGRANTLANPGNYTDTGRVTYDTRGQFTITSATFGSNGFDSFEIDSLAAAVPEPATWGMMILGFGLAGTALRTRRRKVTFATA